MIYNNTHHQIVYRLFTARLYRIAVIISQFVMIFQLFNMVYEMRTRDENKIGHLTMVMTFEEMVILYLSYKPKTHLKVGDIRRAFDRMVFEDQSRGEHGEKTKKGQLTKKSFVHMLKNMGENDAFRPTIRF